MVDCKMVAEGVITGHTGPTVPGKDAMELFATATGTITTLGTASCPPGLLPSEDERGISVGESYTLDCLTREDL